MKSVLLERTALAAALSAAYVCAKAECYKLLKWDITTFELS